MATWRKRVIIGALSCVVVVLAALNFREGGGMRSSSVAHEQEVADSAIELAAPERRHIDTRAPAAALALRQEQENEARVVALRQGAVALYQQADFYDKEAIYQQEFERWERTSGMVDLAARIVARPEQYQDVLGDDQAVTRAYAVRFLLSRDSVEESVLQDVMHQIVDTLDARGEVVAGQEYDLEVVTKALLKRRLGADEQMTPESAVALVQRLLGSSERISQSSGKALSLAFFGHALSRTSEEKARAIAQAVMAAVT